MITLQVIPGGPGRMEIGFRFMQSAVPGAEEDQMLNCLVFRVVHDETTGDSRTMKFRIFAASVAHDPFDKRRISWRLVGLVQSAPYTGMGAIIQFNMANGVGTIHIDDVSTLSFPDWLKENR